MEQVEAAEAQATLIEGGAAAVEEEIRVVSEPEPHPGAAVIERAARGEVAKDEHAQEQEFADATAFLLEAFRGDEGQVEHTLELNVGGAVGSGTEKWIRWTVRSISGQKIRKIRQDAAEASARRGGAAMLVGDPEANFNANVRIVVEGSVSPNIAQAAAQAGLPAPGEFLQIALGNKQGLIDRLASKILALSGWDDDDVRDSERKVAAAVPNS